MAPAAAGAVDRALQSILIERSGSITHAGQGVRASDAAMAGKQDA